MNKHDRGWQWSIWSSLGVAGIMIMSGGCSTATTSNASRNDDLQQFNHVTAQLDRGGSFYAYGNNKYLYAQLAESFESTRKLLETNSATSPGSGKILLACNAFKAGIELLGIQEIQAVGGSSVLCESEPGNHGNLFRNRIYITYGQNQPTGLLWQLTGKENHSLTTELNRLPASTAAAFSWEVEPGELWARIKDFSVNGPFPTFRMIPLMAEMNFTGRYRQALPEVLASMNGTWRGLITADFEKDGQVRLGAALILPGKDRAFFNFLKKWAAKQSNMTVGPDEIAFKPNYRMPLWYRPAIRLDGDQVVFSTDLSVAELLRQTPKPETGLLNSPEFQRFAQNIPQTGTGFALVSPRLGRALATLQESQQEEQSRHLIGMLAQNHRDKGFFCVVRRESDGILITANNTEDLRMMIGHTAVASSLIGMFLTVAGNGQETSNRNACTINLRQLGLALKHYAHNHQGQFPERDNVAGLNVLLKEKALTDRHVIQCPAHPQPVGKNELREADSGYLYLGGFGEGANRNLPLLCDKPGNHRKALNVLFVDGRVARFIADCPNCVRTVEFLNSEFGYSPEELNFLLAKAKKIDQGLKYK